jgi:hypothetical protein
MNGQSKKGVISSGVGGKSRVSKMLSFHGLWASDPISRLWRLFQEMLNKWQSQTWAGIRIKQAEGDCMRLFLSGAVAVAGCFLCKSEE